MGQEGEGKGEFGPEGGGDLGPGTAGGGSRPGLALRPQLASVPS